MRTPASWPASIWADVERFVTNAGPEVTAELLRNLDIDETPDDVLDRLRKSFGIGA